MLHTTPISGIFRVVFGLLLAVVLPSQTSAGGKSSASLIPGEPVKEADRTRLFAEIDKHALAAPNHVETAVVDLARYLSRPARTDAEKARAAYRWVADRIAYDAEALFTMQIGDNSVNAVLESRNCVCEGYARLFVALCQESGLDAVKVSGFAQGPAFGERKKDILRHAWAAVKLDGRWYLFDPTWGAGHIHDKKYRKHYNDYYFQIRPDQLAFTHFPSDEKWQLVAAPISKETFDKQPRLVSHFFRLGFSAEQVRRAQREEKLTEAVKVYDADGKRLLVHEAPIPRKLYEGVKYTFSLESDDFKTIALINNAKFWYCERQDNRFEGWVVPVRGRLRIGGNVNDSRAGQFHAVLEYEVE